MKKSELRMFCALSVLSAAVPAFAQEDETASEPEDLIIVTGAPFAETEDEILTGTSVLSGEELARSAAATIGETLRREPGISTTFFGAGASRPIIRGQGGDRIRVLDNGIGSIDASSASPDHAVAVEPALAERIEIIRGTSVLRYGSSGSGGVVNVIDGRLPSEVPENGFEGAIRGGVTSVDDGSETAGGANFLLGTFGDLSLVGHASFALRKAGDYDIPGFAESSLLRAMEEEEHEHEEEEEEHHDHEEEEEVRDTLENSFAETESFTGGLSLIGERGFFAIAAKSSGTTYGIPAGHDHGHGHAEEHEEEEDHEEEEHGHEEGGVFIELDQTRIDFNGRFEFLSGPFEAVQLFGGFADYEHTEFEGPGEPGTVFSNEGHEVRLELVQTTRNGWRGASGIQIRKRDFSAIGEEAFVPPSETEQYGIYTFQEWESGPWHTEGALRYENTEQSNPTLGLVKTFDAYSASVGAAYHFSDHVMAGLTGYRTERAPTTEELFSNGPHLATGQYEIGDINLGKEVATGIEGVLRMHNARAGVTLNVFYTDYRDYVYEADTGLTGADILMAEGEMDEEELEEFGELAAFQFTAADAVFTGFEIEADAKLAEAGAFMISGDAVIDYVDAEVDGGDTLPRIPPFGATLGVNAESERLFLRGEIEYSAEQDEVTEFELPTDSYTLVNLYADVTPFRDFENVTLSAALLNATDEEARVHTSFLKDEVPLPGRNVRFSVTYRF
ncbi:TonB-dependent receptor [Parvularcula marina]|uniref:TonB-dependent receptor n=1 Tax=Parvularcula marina TaxID=2292771 RepID=A0A371RF27_9PROT|nr:TonB-dependent receptor [Parvularcula marina]RFB04047.1 TonB-dependent receptor [Parvularcula marina]